MWPTDAAIKYVDFSSLVAGYGSEPTNGRPSREQPRAAESADRAGALEPDPSSRNAVNEKWDLGLSGRERTTQQSFDPVKRENRGPSCSGVSK